MMIGPSPSRCFLPPLPFLPFFSLLSEPAKFLCLSRRALCPSGLPAPTICRGPPQGRRRSLLEPGEDAFPCSFGCPCTRSAGWTRAAQDGHRAACAPVPDYYTAYANRILLRRIKRCQLLVVEGHSRRRGRKRRGAAAGLVSPRRPALYSAPSTGERDRAGPCEGQDDAMPDDQPKQTPQDRDGQTGGGPAPDGPALDGPDLDDLARRYVDRLGREVSRVRVGKYG